MSSNILGTFWYLKGLDLWATTKPYFINVPQNALPEGQRASNEVSEPANGVLVRSMRDANAPNDIDLCGFSYRTHDFDISAEVFRDSAAVRRQYIPRVEEWLQQITGAETVHTLTFEVRRRDIEFPKKVWGVSGEKQPIQGVHCDYTPRYAHQRLEELFGKERAVYLAQRRFQILNIWRPLFGPLRDWPLGVCDFRSLDLSRDLIASDNILPHTVGETYNVLHNPQHQWYYLKDQMPYETLVFKSFDSMSGVAVTCPHASFDLTPTLGLQRRRESVEVLLLVVYPESNAAGLVANSGQW